MFRHASRLPALSHRKSPVLLNPFWLLACFFLLTVAACQPEAVALVTLEPDTPRPAITKITVPPPVVITVAGQQNRHSFSPLDAAELAATATSAASLLTTDNSAEITNDSMQVVQPQSPTPTPMPTFTPPALPKTSPWEHYWLRRPVPEESTVWTDKAYPYGSNRGGTLRTHHGVEFNVPRRTEVLAAASGTVVVAGDDQISQLGATTDFYGNVVVIEHDSGIDDQMVYTVYGHLSEIMVDIGQHVHALDVIALSGASGVADGPHLHFEVRVGENTYENTRNPLLWLYPFPDRGVVAGKITTADGKPANGAQISLRRIDAPSAYAATSSYADDSVNPDDIWQENFALDDIVAGYYELTVGSGKDKIKTEFWVYAYQTSFVELALDP